MPPALLFFLKIDVAICGLLYFHTKFKSICCETVKNASIFIFCLVCSLRPLGEDVSFRCILWEEFNWISAVIDQVLYSRQGCIEANGLTCVFAFFFKLINFNCFLNYFIFKNLFILIGGYCFTIL